MENKFKNYVIYLSILTAILMGVYYFFRNQLSVQSAYVIPAYFLITLVTHMFLRQAFSKDPSRFSMNFMAAMAFKMLAAFAFLTVIFLVFKGITMDFVAVFMGVYLVYTVFELVYLRPAMRSNAPKKDN